MRADVVPAQHNRVETNHRTCSPSRGVADGIRTRDRRHHKPELYQLSYCHLAGGILGDGGDFALAARG